MSQCSEWPRDGLICSMWQDIHHKIKPEEVELVRRDYVANEGWETFLSYEDTHQVNVFIYSL